MNTHITNFELLDDVSTFLPDATLQLKSAGLIAVDGAAQVGSANRILDLGDARTDAHIVIDVSAIEVASANEQYNIIAQFSNSSSFASGIFSGPILSLGAASANIRSAASTTGRYVVPFRNKVNDVVYQYMRLYNDVSGTIATGINYVAYVSLMH